MMERSISISFFLCRLYWIPSLPPPSSNLPFNNSLEFFFVQEVPTLLASTFGLSVDPITTQPVSISSLGIRAEGESVISMDRPVTGMFLGPWFSSYGFQSGKTQRLRERERGDIWVRLCEKQWDSEGVLTDFQDLVPVPSWGLVVSLPLSSRRQPWSEYMNLDLMCWRSPFNPTETIVQSNCFLRQNILHSAL